MVWVDKDILNTNTLSTSFHQGCVLSPFLFTLPTYECTARFTDSRTVKFADEITVVGLITGGDESMYKEKVKLLVEWCSDNNLTLNVDKTKEMVDDFRRSQQNHMHQRCQSGDD